MGWRLSVEDSKRDNYHKKKPLRRNDNQHLFHVLNYNRLTLWSQPILILQIALFSLEYGFATLLASAHNKVNQLYVHIYIFIYIYIPLPLDLPSQLPTPSHSSRSSHNIKLSSLSYTGASFPLAIYLPHVYTSASFSVHPILPFPLLCPEVHSLCLYLYSCSTNMSISTNFDSYICINILLIFFFSFDFTLLCRADSRFIHITINDPTWFLFMAE